MNDSVLFEAAHLRVVSRNNWEFVDRTRGSGVVGIVALTDDRKVVLVEQFRIPLKSRVLELPAGLTGDEQETGEEPAVSAMRELYEETGYAAESMELLSVGPSSAGLTSEVVSLFLARGVRRVGNGGGVGAEQITVHEIPLDIVDPWLDGIRKQHVLIDFKVYAGLYFLKTI